MHKGEFDKIIIIHGCPISQDNVLPKSKRWMNWLEDKLKEKGYNAVAPDMPTPWLPKYSEWRVAFEKLHVTSNSLLIGHSCGGAFLVRWLLETGITVKKLILVAPAKVPESKTDPRQDLYNFEISQDASNIAHDRVIFISNDFPHLMESFKMYKKSLKPRIIKLENRVHFLYIWTKTNEFPELLEEVLTS